MTLASRYWASLTGRVAMTEPPQRGREGYSLGRRYLAALLGITLPPRDPVAPHPSAEPQPAPTPPPRAVTRPARHGRGWALAVGVAFGVAVVFSAVFLTGPDESSPVGSGPPLASTEPSRTDVEPTGGGRGDAGPILFGFMDTNEVPRCVTLTGTGTSPGEDVAVLLVFRKLDGSVRFGNVLTFTGDEWHTEVEVGTEEDANRQFTLAIYVVPPEVAGKWAVAADVPLSEVPTEPLEAMTVIRTNDSTPC